MTAEPEISGTIVLDSSADSVGYELSGSTVSFGGRIDIDSVTSSPRNFFDVTGLPFQVANITDRGGMSSATLTMIKGGVFSVVPSLILTNSYGFRVYTDPSTLVNGDSFYFRGAYFTED